MIRSLRLIHTPLGSAGAGPEATPSKSPTAGAVLTFLGVVRNREGEAPILGLHYESFEAMAEHQFRKLFDQLEARWPQIESVVLVHRLGFVPVAEPSLRIDVAAPHRGEAFAACEWLIDEMKRVVPIWKRPVAVPEPGSPAP